MQNNIPLILIVDDNPQNIKVLAESLEVEGIEVAMATDGASAIGFIETEQPDLILLDIMMPKMDGVEVCKRLKENPQTKTIPVIFLTAKVEPEDIVKGFETGAVDYLVKPFNTVEMNARIKNHLELKLSRDKLKKINEELIIANETIVRKNRALEDAMEKLQTAASTDALTGLYNRRYILNKIHEETVRHNRNGKIFSFIMCDVDRFKSVNDLYGHDCGDAVLIEVTKHIQSLCRCHDVLSRWGGEEFLLLLPETDEKGAYILAERIRAGLEQKVIAYEAIKLKLTLTLGIAEYDAKQGIDGSIKIADNALLKGKSNGRNRVEIGVLE